ncbi:hypothetical protein L3X38_041917 [Prunus dulcis]|uniref:Uncharacterized protein n=1 Tax=Prunus dulcis TaxID=3755 RepID=A0AAD4YLC5_PRUDU|nr:hypothetical protein L3X38_041917 [Prunus dulcis]
MFRSGAILVVTVDQAKHASPCYVIVSDPTHAQGISRMSDLGHQTSRFGGCRKLAQRGSQKNPRDRSRVVRPHCAYQANGSAPSYAIRHRRHVTPTKVALMMQMGVYEGFIESPASIE